MCKPDTYERSYNVIINTLLSFPTISDKDWQSCFGDRPPIGSLVSLQSAPPSDWQVSWLEEIEYKEDSNGNKYPARYLLKSIKDYSLCWWENVGLSYYCDTDRIMPNWKWTDRQFTINDRWMRVCYGDHDAYLTRPNQLKFLENHKVELSCRKHIFCSSDAQHKRVFEDWRKLTKKMMGEFYLEACGELEKS